MQQLHYQSLQTYELTTSQGELVFQELLGSAMDDVVGMRARFLPPEGPTDPMQQVHLIPSPSSLRESLDRMQPERHLDQGERAGKVQRTDRHNRADAGGSSALGIWSGVHAREMWDLSPELVDEIRAWLGACDVPWADSPLYSSARSSEYVDTSVRRSSARSLIDPALFALAERVVAHASATDELYTYSLVRDDVSHLRYDVGGFFRPHQDFCSLTSNMYEEFTLLLCVSPAQSSASGGATCVYATDPAAAAALPEGGMRSFASTATPGGALIFRKSAWHEGEPLTAGVKELLSLNLWGVRKPFGGVPSGAGSHADSNSKPRLLRIIFPRNEDSSAEAAGGAATSSTTTSPATTSMASVAALSVAGAAGAAGALQREAVRPSFVVSAQDVDACGESVFSAFLSRWAPEDASHGSASDVPSSCHVATYRCSACTMEQFEPIYRILTGHTLCLDELRAHVDLILFFFPQLPSSLRLDARAAFIAADADGVLALSTSPYYNVLSQHTPLVEQDLIICESEARTAQLAEYARLHNLPFVRFRLVFLSKRQYDDDDCDDYQIQGGSPMWSILGELVDRRGRRIPESDWETLADAHDSTSRCRRLQTAESSRAESASFLAWLSLGDYDNIACLGRAGLLTPSSSALTPPLAPPPLAPNHSWVPEDVYKDEDNAMGRLGVAFHRLVQGFSFAEMRASNSHWAGENSAELDALRRGSAYKYTTRGLICDIYLSHGDPSAAWLEEVRRKLTDGGVSPSNVEVLFRREPPTFLRRARRNVHDVVRVRNARNSQVTWLHQTFADRAYGQGRTSVQIHWPDWKQSCEALDLMLAWPTSPAHGGVATGIKRLVLEGARTAPVELCALPGAYEGGDSSAPAGHASGYFHRDAAGCTCFTKEEAASASARVCEMHLEGRVKERIPPEMWRAFRQMSESGSEWCNDCYNYSEVSVFQVTGLVSLEHGLAEGTRG